MQSAAIIVAAGRGTRAGGDQPKQWQPLAGRRVIDWTVAAFQATPEVSRIVVVLHPDDLGRYDPPAGVEVTTGGAERSVSVRLGLEYLADSGFSYDSYVAIHDVARSCTKPAYISYVLYELSSGTQDRTGLFRAQTPQAFVFGDIFAAHRAHQAPAADDVEVARAAGLPVRIIEGDENNLKITHAQDFARAEKILDSQMDIRCGNGYDVHRFGDGDHVILCGVKIPHSLGLQGHSDADVGMHALTDAIYGALALGDIGRHFPPSDPQWKGAESHNFLRHAVQMARENGFEISNVDVTLICERPKIGPHAEAMQKALSEIMGVDATRVSVKATTSERLGFTGREEGIAAQATATLVKK
jgi:2-C-methyl-D-erythritol 4-phosphate cytidylyltransferase/2-C-methyl-D-erythritol 2,4-cyclodiphosphate synthase